MSKKSWLGACLALAFIVAGCGSQPGKTTISYGRGKAAPPLTKAGTAGSYALYPSNGVTPVYTAVLDEGDEYGFIQKGEGDDKKVFGYADGTEIPLTGWLTTSYYWKMQEKK